MKPIRSLYPLVLAVSVLFTAAAPALAEFQCAPEGAKPTLPISDPFFASETTAWSSTTKGRYTEGTGGKACRDVAVPGYEGLPTKRCTYAEADAGKGRFPPLNAEVIVLNPSSQQLASWSINACRTNGAPAAAMPKCLEKLRNSIESSNGAQFPVVGSVVESYCNSSNKYGACGTLDETSVWLRPRHTWFRDGVAVDYKDTQGVHWDDRVYSQATFEAILDVSKSDANLGNTFNVARVAAAEREQWRAWRHHVGKPEMLDGLTGTVDGGGWRTVAAAVHKSACRGSSNELFNAVVFANGSWTKP
ncbi:hypothetical protein NKH34_30660 [Mesorhizobium sp. M1148]|uniref:hypothetical protein n=1 Tax=unclassified Mesorhizobium TaxID=325217 RepID=UPI0004CEFE71|nr:hypothetical protein [Mesorhizobium sp. LSJC269B00]